MKSIFLLFFLFSAYLSYSQKYEWDITNGTPGFDSRQDVSLDMDGNIYIIGTYHDTIDVDPGPAVYNLFGTGTNNYSYVIKYSSSGDLIWAFDLGISHGKHIEITKTQEIVISGTFGGQMDADPSTNTSLIYTGNGESGEYIIKLDLNGNYIWGKSISWESNTSSLQTLDITSDEIGNIYFTASYWGTVDVDPSSSIYNLDVTQTFDGAGVIFKINNNGIFSWAKTTKDSRGITIFYSNSSNLYIGGNFSGTVDFDPSSGVDIFISTDYNPDGFITKLDSSGNYLWTKTISGPGSQRISGITSDNLDFIYTYGMFNNSTDFDTSPGIETINAIGQQDIYIQKHNSNGDYLWTKTIGNTNSFIVSQQIEMGSDSTLYITGGYRGKVDFDPSPQIHYSETEIAPNFDIFIEKFDNNGNFSWFRTVKTDLGQDSGYSLASNNTDTLYMTGTFANTRDFNWGYGESIHSSNGFKDNVLIKVTNCISPSYGNSNITACDSLVSLSGNQVFYTSGNYIDTTYTFYGCDSIINLTLTIVNSSSIFDSIIVSCDSIVWRGQNINTTGVYYDSLQNITGCDSIRRLHFTLMSYDIDTMVTTCNSFFWRDSTYQQSGIYKDSLISSLNCDSITTLNLTILNTTEGYDFQTSCNSFTWTNGITYSSSNDTATDTIYNGASNGCDSIITLNLTILNYGMGIDIQNACDSLTWTNGNTYYGNNNSATDTIYGGSSNGCDSIITLNLTINTVDITTSIQDPTITSNAINASFNWLDCNNNFNPIQSETSSVFTSIQNGDYAVEVTQNNCIDTSECITISTVSLGNINIFEQVTIVPNPSSGLFNIILNAWEDVSITVYSSTGSIVFEDNHINSSTYQLRLNEPPGIYFIEILYNGSRNRIKLILE